MTKFRAKIQANLNDLSGKDLELANYLIEQTQSASKMTIQSISETTGISTATISRFAKRMGYDNFQALRFDLVQDNTENERLFAEINDDDSLISMAHKIFTSNIDALKSTSENLNETALEQAIDLLKNSQSVGLYGLGASNIVALDGYHKFLRTPLNVSYALDFHMQLMAMTRLTDKDVAVIISHTGTDVDAIELAKIAQENNVPIILITGASNTVLTNYATVTLQAIAEETQYRSEALHALIAQMSLMDTLYILTSIKMDVASTKVANKIRGTIKKTRK